MGFSYEDQQLMPCDLIDKLLIYQGELSKYEMEENKKAVKKK